MSSGVTLEGSEKEGGVEEKRDGWHAGGRGGRSNDMVGGATVVLGRCIVGVLAFNLTAQFH